jgi:Sugar nucleotidyl transferase
MNLVLFDDHSWDNLLPLTFTRPVSGLRVGILTIAEKWEKHLNTRASFLTREYLGEKFPLEPGSDSLLINGALLPDETVLKAMKDLPAGGALKKENVLLGVRKGIESGTGPGIEPGTGSKTVFEIDEWLSRATEYNVEISLVDFPWKIFTLNGQEIVRDFNLVTGGRESGDLSSTVQVIGNGNLFVEPGFKGEYITLNTTGGPVYLGTLCPL